MKQSSKILFFYWVNIFFFVLIIHNNTLAAAQMTLREDISSQSNKVESTDSAAKPQDSLEQQLAQHPQYVLAHNLLNATIMLLETRITPEQHNRLSRWQKKWKDGEQATEVAKLSKKMSLVEAYTKATEERNAVLLRIAAVVPSTGTYQGKLASFSVSAHDGTLTVQGSAYNEQGKVCTFQGIGALKKGWIQVSNQSASDFHVLFTPKAAYIYYGEDAKTNCSEGIIFRGAYNKE